MKNQVRRYSQILFFILFLILLIQTEYKGTDQLGTPVRLFLGMDPLIGLAVVIAARGIFFFVVGTLIAMALFAGLGKLISKFASKSGWSDLAREISMRYIPLAIAVIMFAWAIFPFGLDQGWALAMALGVVTVAVTLLIGRVFCGWVCPMGAMLQFVSWLKKDKRKARIEKNQFHPHQKWKYYLLAGLLVASLLGFQIVGLIDPISSIIRSFSLVVSPVINQAANRVLDVAYSTGIDAVADVSQSAYDLIAYPNVLSFDEPHFMGSFFVAAFFIFVLAMNLARPRYWCRVLCPLGALLGSMSRTMPYRLQVTKEKCHGCGQCSLNCQGACDPEFKDGWRPSECFLCFYCVDSCPTKALQFSFTDIKNRKENKVPIDVDLNKRRMFQAVGAALVGVPLLKASEQYKENVGGATEGPAVHNPDLIRPPGSLPEPEFLNRCVRCGECMKVCPTNGLHPATLEAGVEGMWTPILVPRLGYCEYYCTLCGQVCPTGAIEELTVADKQKTIIGTAFFDVNRCLPYAFGVSCIVCEEHCPTSPKAIWFEEVPNTIRPDENDSYTDPYGDSSGEGMWASPTEQVQPDSNEQPAEDPYAVDSQADPYADPYGGTTSQPDIIRKPRIDLDLCIGCGICEKVCVVADKPAVRITSVGESRSNVNAIKFEGSYEGY